MILRTAFLALLASTTVQATAAELPHGSSHPDNPASALVISPIFSELVAFEMPLDFQVVNEQASPHAYIREAVPIGETAEQWTRMITVTGYKDIAADPGAPPAVLLNMIADGFKKACPDTVSIGNLGNPPIDGHPAAIAFMACGTTGYGGESHSEAALIMAIQGARDYYTIQWAERGPAQATRVTFDEQHWLGRLTQLLPVFLCTRIPGEEEPYPSCAMRLTHDDEPARAIGRDATAAPSIPAPATR